MLVEAVNLTRVHVFDGDVHIDLLLRSWIKTVLRYCSFQEGDNCWWYNERASLSVLAAAAWETRRAVALEEYSTSKRPKAFVEGVEGDQLRHGRCDLHIAFRTDDTIRTFAFEAKQCRQRTGDRAKPLLHLHKAMDKAWDDVGHLTSREGDIRYAATFALPTIRLTDLCPEGMDSGICAIKVRERVARWLYQTRDFRSPRKKETSFAYVFPSIGECKYVNKSWLFPGVVLILEKRLKAKPKSSIDEA